MPNWDLSPIVRRAAVLSIALLALVPAAARATPFVSEAVDTLGGTGCYTDIHLDARDIPQIVSYDYTNGDCRYATRVGNTWKLEIVDAAGDVGGCNSLGLDSKGNPHVSYTDQTSTPEILKYARRLGGVWIRETVAANCGHETALDVDGLDQPHVAYLDVTGGVNSVRYGKKVGGTWTFETVPGSSGGGTYISLRLDAAGNPRIAYSAGLYALMYAYKNNGVWTTDTVDPANFSAATLFMVLDPEGNPYISYGSSTLKMASKTGASWVTETVDASATVGATSSIALDAANNPNISYFDATNSDLKYAVKKNGTWSTEVVDGTSVPLGVETGLALDSKGAVHISYWDFTNGDLKYATSAVILTSPISGELWASGTQQQVTWMGAGAVDVALSTDGGFSYSNVATGVSGNAITLEAPAVRTNEARIRITRASPFSSSQSPGLFSIAPDLVSPFWAKTADGSAASTGRYSSIALDSHGNPRISYYDFTNFDLKLATRTGGSWYVETADGATSQVGTYTSLRLDTQGNPRISYQDGTNLDLKYASKSNGVWTLEVADGSGGVNVGSYTSLALDALGNPRISYFDSSNQRLKYASKSGTWTTEVVDATPYAGISTSIAVDATGNPHISYYISNFGMSDLRYATKSGGTWTVETVDSDGDVGQYSSIGVDPQGNPRISYWDLTNGDLKYASKSNGLWTLETADVGGSVGAFSSLAVDERGNPSISYWDGTNADLKYAERRNGLWNITTVDSKGSVGGGTSIVLDAVGRPRISYYDNVGDLKYASAAIEGGDPAPGAVWPVGARRTVTWNGTGRVDLALSIDGGASYQALASDLTGGQYRLTVPYTPSKFCKVRLTRVVPPSSAVTDTFFTINTSVSLLTFTAQLPADGSSGAELTWNTDPGPEDLAGYRVDRSAGGGDWQTVVSMTRENSYRDPAGGPSTRYRLFAVNGLGEQLWLGEASMRPLRPLSAWPLPYRSGEMTVAFATAGGLGGGKGEAEVALFDLGGRLVKRFAKGPFDAGVQQVTWDGRDERGVRVRAGIYFLRSRSLGHDERLRVVVMP